MVPCMMLRIVKVCRARALRLGFAILVGVSCGALVAQRPAASAPGGATPPETGSKDMGGGLLYGENWVITFGYAPKGWVEDTGLANELGVTAVFHPEKWSEKRLSPAILLSYVDKEGGKNTVASEMVVDAKETLQDNATTKILPDADLVAAGGAKSPSRIFINDQGWSRVIYRDGASVVFLSTLRCWKARDCSRFEPAFEAFTASLLYHGNVSIVRK